MQREIKFRGLTLSGEWIFGHYNRSITPAKHNNIHTYDRILQKGVENYFVIPETVGQFTGLTDKNGKEIYEGDILCINTKITVFRDFFENDEEVDQEIISEVFYNEIFASFELKTIEEDVHLKSWGFYGEDSYDLEIIGNIHDNPELLK